jgi:uncharacterized protein (DUF4415 family)
MAKANRTDNETLKGRSTPAAKSRSRASAAKMQSPARPTVEPVRTGWATDLVFDVREPKLAVSLRLDADVLRFFRGFGEGYQTRINEVLRAFMQARGTPETVPRAVLGARAGRGSIGNGKRAR